MQIIKYIGGAFLLLLITRCRPEAAADYQFQLLESAQTGIDFSNTLVPTKAQNIFSYMYFYNGSGIGAGDFNNDGNVDLFFGANQTANRLYLNEGKFKFRDITQVAFGKAADAVKGWTNGVSVVDINQDGLLDIYLSQVGGIDQFTGRNLLWVCREINADGIPVYEEKAHDYGLDLTGLGTQAAFFDYDGDGDLDMFQLNHSLHQNGTFGPRHSFQGKPHPLAGDHFFRNDNGKFTEVTEATGIHNDVLGYGLGLSVGDINVDGRPDMYVGNDFHENDYLYINQGDGTFRDELMNSVKHTSQFSMGVDIGDINNDAFPEIMSLDMLPYEREILKRSEAEDSYAIYTYKLSWGYGYQFPRNNLQLNNRNGTFSEIGLYANVFATDWSWSPLWLDFDNDGRKDLFISNGIPKRVNDMDYLQFISDATVQQRIDNQEFTENDKLLIDKLPEIKIPNQFFNGTPTLQFADAAARIKNNKNSYSNGAVYADLDNDGDLDIITNNINDKPFIYENLAKPNGGNSLTIELKGSPYNQNAVGTKCLVFKANGDVLNVEKFPVRGFQSSAEIPLTVGIGKAAEVDSVLLIWPDNHYQKIAFDSAQNRIQLAYRPGLPMFNYADFRQKQNTGVTFTDITAASGLSFRHEENPYNEFEQSGLLPHMISAEGPALAVADVNQDGLEDVFVGNGAGSIGKVFFQQKNGKFIAANQPALAADAAFEDVDAVFADVNHDTFPDLLVGSGGNQFTAGSDLLQPRLYLNDGRGNFRRQTDAFGELKLDASAVRVFDFNNDQRPDVLITARLVSFKYGIPPASYLLENDGNGHFRDVTKQFAPDLAAVGMVKNAELTDIDGDKDPDILLAMDWGAITLLENQGGKFVKKVISPESGWWNFTKTFDADNDGDLDILAGNLGLNSRLKATPETPVRMYVNDFDKNGVTDQILSYTLNGEEIIFANKIEAEKQFPHFKKKFIYAKDFAKASINDLLGEENVKESRIFSANYFANTLFVNDGKGNFTTQPLPYYAQFTPYASAELMHLSPNSLNDLLLLGNFYESNVQQGRYDADYGLLLKNAGDNQFNQLPINGLRIDGQVRRSAAIKVGQQKAIIIAKNNDYLQLIQQKAK